MQKEIFTDVDERRREYFIHSKKTDGYNFSLYRTKIMTEEERKLGERIVVDFRNAYEAKERAGVFKDMAIAEQYWSGEFQNKTPDMLANVNFINSNIETQVADLMDQNIDIEPHPYEPSDEPYTERVRKIGEKILALNNIPLKIQRIVRGFKMFGHGWIQVLFNPKMLEGKGCPEIEYVSSNEIFPDPAISKVDDINKGRFFIRAYPSTIKEAERQFGMEKASAIYPGYAPYRDVNISSALKGTIDTTAENYLHILYWTYYEDNGKQKLRLIQCSGCGVILKDSLDFEKDKGIAVFPTTDEPRYPYWLCSDMERENSIWGKSNASLLYPLQDVSDEIDNAILANARLTGNPQRLILSNSGIDPEQIDNVEGTTIISNVADGVTYMQPPSMPQYIIDRRNQIVQNERIIVSRVSDQQAGVKQHGVDTATESLALQQNALKAVDATKTILQLILADVLMYCIELAIEYWNEDMFFVDENKQFEHFNPHDLTQIPELTLADENYIKAFKTINPNATNIPLYMEKQKGNKTVTRKIHVLMSLSIGAGMPKNKAFMYNIINETFNKGAMTQDEYREKLNEYVGLPYDKSMKQQTNQQNSVEQGNVPMGQSRDALNGGVSPNTLNKIEEQRTGGNYGITK